MTEVVVCTLIAGSRQSGDWNRLSGMLAPNYMERILLICLDNWKVSIREDTEVCLMGLKR